MGSMQAVLIGVDVHDDGSPELLGARNDVALWWRFLVGRLRLDPAAIRVLHGGPLPAALLVGGPDAARSQEEHARLEAAAATTMDGAATATPTAVESALADADAAAGPEGRVLVVFSGHGMAAGASEAALRLVGSDSDKDAGGHSLPLAVLTGGALGGDAAVLPSAPARRITVIDACFGRPVLPSGALVRGLHGPVWTGSGRPPAGPLLLACGPREVAVETVHGGRPHGAFTAALLGTLEHWRVEVASGTAALRYGTLLAAATAQLEGWGLSQRPLLQGPAGRHGWSVLDVEARAGAVQDPGPQRTVGERQVIVGGLLGAGDRADGYRFDLIDKDGVRTTFLRMLVTSAQCVARYTAPGVPPGTSQRWDFPADRELIAVVPAGIEKLRGAAAGDPGTATVEVQRVADVYANGKLNVATFVKKLVANQTSLASVDRTPADPWVKIAQAHVDTSLSTKTRRVCFRFTDTLQGGDVKRAMQLRVNEKDELVALRYATENAPPLTTFFAALLPSGAGPLSAALVADDAHAPFTESWVTNGAPLSTLSPET